jgi:magnesium-transporting ATPase (P-type)
MVALRGATIGVSLCDAETLVAAPITSKVQSPSSVVDVMCKKGRASLITAYVLILFTLMYGLIQLFFTLELYYFGLLVGDNMYIIQDLVYTLVLGYTMCKAEACSILSIQQPPKRFLISQNIVKFLLMIGFFLLFQILSFYSLSSRIL